MTANAIKAAAVALIVSLLVAAAVDLGTRHLPARYQANAIFRVGVPNQQGVNDSVVTAGNDLATQYAQLADSSPVIDGTAAALKEPASTLSGEISGGTVGAQNLVQVTARAATAAEASARAAAAIRTMLAYLVQIDTQQGATYARNASKYLAPINQTLTNLSARVRTDRPSQRATDSVVLATLLEQRQQALASLATDAAAGEPTLQLISTGSGASQVSPRPTLYALIAFVVVLLISCRVAFLYVERAPRAPRRRSVAPASGAS